MDKWVFSDGWDGVCPGNGGGTAHTFNGYIDGNNFNLLSAPSSVSTIDTFAIQREYFQQSNGSFFPNYGNGVTTTYPWFSDTTGIVRIHMDFGEGIMFPGNIIDDASFVLFDNNGVELEWLPYKAIPDPSFGVGQGGFPRGADFYFRLSDAKIDSYTWVDFLGSSRLYYRFKGYCPAAQPNTQVNYSVFLKGDTLCTAGCEIAMSTSQTLINVKCPGCKVPGPVASMDIRRESYGFTDNNRDGLADLPLRRVNPNGLQINPAMAVVGDTISLTIRGNLPNGDNNGGIEFNNLEQQLGPLKYIYLEAKGFPALNRSIRALDTFQVIIKRGANTVGARTFRTNSILQSAQNGTFFYQIPVDSMGYSLAINDFFYLRTNFVIQRNMLDVVTDPVVVPKQVNVTLGIGNKSLNNKDEAADGANGVTFDPSKKYFFYCEADSKKFTFVPYDTAALYAFYYDPYGGDVCNKHMSLYANFRNLVVFPYEFRKSSTVDSIRFNIPPSVHYKENKIEYFNNSQGRPYISDYPNVSTSYNQVIFFPKYAITNNYAQGIIPLNSGSNEFQGSALYERNCDSNVSRVSFTFPSNSVSITLPDSGNPIGHPKLKLKFFDDPYGRFFYNDTTHEVFSDFATPNLQIDAVTDNISTSPDTLLPFSIRSTNGVEAINVFMDISTRGSNRFIPQQLLEISGNQIIPIAKPTGSNVFRLNNIRTQRQFRIVGTYSCRSASDKRDTLLIRYGWRCGGYPNIIDTTSCAYNKLDTAYYYINTSEAGIQLPTQISGPDSLSMCGTNTFSYTMNPLGEKVYNFHNSMTLPSGVSVDSVIYVLNNVNYPSPFTVSQNKVNSISDQAFGLAGVGIRAGTSFRIKYVLRFPCGFNVANNTLKVSAFGFSYCGLKVPANDSLTSVFPSKIKGLIPPQYTVSVPKTVNMGCLDLTEVQIKVTPTVASNRPGRDTIRILVPKELELSFTPKFSTIRSGTLFDTLRLALPSIPQIGVTQTISFYISRAQGLPYCGKRDIQTDIVSGRGLVCTGQNCSVSFKVGQTQFSSVNLLACGLATPVVSGVSESCGNTAQTYSITNTYPSGTSYVWSVSSFANNKNLTVSPSSSGIQSYVSFGNKPGMDTLVVSAYNSSGCSSAALKLPIKTNPLPLTQANITTSLFVDYLDGKGEI
ncbi:MAG: hypothetical protein K2Q22_02115, partial [Cytophagales bacterium]|nr:hypothetical protein [Cytophagales bacterium]